MIDATKYQEQASELSQKLWAIANDLRGNMDSTKFRNYILGTIFYSYLSERTEEYMQELLKADGLSYEQAFADAKYGPIVEQWSIKHLGYIIKPKNLFRELVRKIVHPSDDRDKFSVEDYERAVNELTGSTMGQASAAAFSGLFNDMKLHDPDLGDTVADRTALIAKVIVQISEIDFKLSDSQFDVLGTAYMILLGLFASDAGKKSGEFFTPTGPSKLVATLATVGLDEAKTVGDCTCGSASMLLEVQKHLTTGRVGHFYGQENNATTYNLARMNMLMHGVDYQNFDIYKGDTLREDKYGDVKMTVQVCNPPYSLKYDGNPALLHDLRYSGAGKLPPKSHADYAFVEHMIYHMDDDDGRVAVLLPHGVLFRGGAEAVIRKYIIKDLNRLDAVIGLAPNLFHGTSIPVCLLVLKSKRNGNSDNVLFIDASKEFKPGKNQNTLEDEHIKKIVNAYTMREDIEKFAHVADMAEIEANDWNLNILRYVDTYEEEEPVDLEAVRDDIKRIEGEKKASADKVESMLRQLGI
ncbi:type I restriction-modification system subunit M [Bifidobacterium coryneforme]|uniref:site-specific DNA-methyltransferase (adenine-specific) n=1 Tax=Bifidobacterium [indicum] DSM 20214 = LMG 11587 TaxID=1341694 RepID=A0A087VSG6_9BIFI|nr:type I restriction-modification system subunit M [Bifidobacterium indicum]AIC91300.1 Type I restriction-modification system N6-adenine DNA methyltransferase (M) subunit of unknown recognition sequence [Bifidobacterium indicum LMG 11587 = DSM 20214]